MVNLAAIKVGPVRCMSIPGQALDGWSSKAHRDAL